jgi:hypothetical protein
MSGPKTLLAELDQEAPGIGIRCGLPPQATSANDLIQAVPFEHVSVFTPPLRGGPLSQAIVAQLLDAARSTHETIVLDVGPNHQPLAGDVIVVCDPSPTGIVRCARFLEVWRGPQPHLVVNRAPHDVDVRLVRRATGLEPAALIPNSRPPHPGEAPPSALVRGLEPLTEILYRKRPSRQASIGPGQDADHAC